MEPSSSGGKRACGAQNPAPRLACVHRRGRGHEWLALPPRELQTLRIPGVELAQIAPCPLHAEVLLGARDDPLELLHDLLRARLAVVGAEQPAEEPWVAERASGQHHGRRPAV